MEIQEQVKEWKDKYTYVYRMNLLGKDFYFRTLTREDYMDILAIQASDPRAFDHDIEVVRKCVLSPLDPAELKNKAGISTVLAEKIMLASGFEIGDIEEV
jgi:hypothetical protein